MNQLWRTRGLFSALFTLTLFASQAFAAEPAHLVISELPGGVRILVDEAGRTLYASTADADGVSNCTDECAEQWQPLLTTGRPVVRPGLIPGFVGSIDRDEGSQVTFLGQPLYYFADDAEPGDTLGQGVDDSWFVVSHMGELHREELLLADAEGEDAAYELDEEVMATGQGIYQSLCAACHAADGSGAGGGPALAGGTNIANTTYVLGQIIHGGAEMPSFGGVLSDEEVAAVTTYVRNSFGNAEPPVTPEEAEAVR